MDHTRDAARYMPTEALKRLVKHSEELLEGSGVIEYPPGSGRYVMIIGPSMAVDLAPPVTAADWALWALEDEWDNMIEGSPDWHVSDTPPSDRSPDDR